MDSLNLSAVSVQSIVYCFFHTVFMRTNSNLYKQTGVSIVVQEQNTMGACHRSITAVGEPRLRSWELSRELGGTRRCWGVWEQRQGERRRLGNGSKGGGNGELQGMEEGSAGVSPKKRWARVGAGEIGLPEGQPWG